VSRRKSRIIAFQALYSWNVSRVPTEELLTFSWLKKDSEFTPNELEEQTFASFIISGTIDHLDEIDNLISSHLSSSWTMERINKVSLAILRTSTYEIKFQATTSGSGFCSTSPLFLLKKFLIRSMISMMKLIIFVNPSIIRPPSSELNYNTM
jgi:hypothetical protein